MSADLVAKCVRALHAEYVLSEVEAERITKIVLAIALPAPSGTEAMRDEIATIVNPYAFVPDSSGDDLIADIVRQDKEHAYRQTDRILALVRGANMQAAE